MPRRLLVLVCAVTLGIAPFVARADPPTPDPNFAGTIIPKPCGVSLAPDGSGAINTYEQKQFSDEGWAGPGYVRYPGACQRLQFRFGPIVVKPGQNDVLVQPVTIEKPAYDGYLTRFSPNLVEADGTVPPIEKIHLHHGTWITLTDYAGGVNTPVYDGRTYGSGPFFASGEEKTIADFPRGFGMPIKATDQWQLLYMVHNLTSQPDVVYITYDIDYIPASVATSDAFVSQFGALKPIYPIWNDVYRGSSYPVFNVQRGVSPGSTCTWPRENCARFDPWGNITDNQGKAVNEATAEASGDLHNILTMPKAGDQLGRIDHFYGGELIGLGGHLHPGGLADEVDQIRGGVAKNIFTSEAKYWSWSDPSSPTGPANSWDLSMTVTGLPRWAVHLEPGDSLRIEGVYDQLLQSTYENMGIAVGYISPDPAPGQWAVPQAIDPFTSGAAVDDSEDCASGGLQASPPVLCTKGLVTHGHMAEANNHGGLNPVALSGAMGPHTDNVAIGGFDYTPGGLGQISVTGIPTVTLGKTVTFTNFDMAADIYHTVTSCALPCTGSTGISYPLSNQTELAADGTPVDFDSSELGYGPSLGPAANRIQWTLSIDPSQFQSGHEYTYFCRIHPSMRGVFAVE